MTVPIIICPRCMRYSALPADVTNRWCGNCRRETGGRVIELPDPGRVIDAERAKALYGLELLAGRALANLATEDDVVAAVRRGIGAFLVTSRTSVPADAVVAKLAAGGANEWDLIYRPPAGE